MSMRNDSMIIPPNLAIRSLRDSGYKNTAYALAELIDNSIQAKASTVELMCVEAYVDTTKSSRKRLTKIATLDNGCGMGSATLSMALQFGNGTHLDDRTGIGRFGMGLPNSSISQCRKLDVWTWQSGPDNALHSYLDVAEIESGKTSHVPKPTKNPVPEEWRARSQGIGTSGTLVVWSHFEEHRLSWRGAATTIRHTEEIVGRMYRKFISSGEAIIHFVTISPDVALERRQARVNDPLYLMENSMTSEPFNKEPMFEPWGDHEFFVNYQGKEHKVITRFSLAKKKTIPPAGVSRGLLPYGKDAGKNAGLSIVREGRELELDKSWTSDYDPRDRWWGAEIEFPATLDEIFGVTNNKQHATILSQFARYDWGSEANKGEILTSFAHRLVSENDPRGYLIEIVDYMNRQIKSMRDTVALQGRGHRSVKRYDDDAAKRANEEFLKRQNSGHIAPSDNEIFTEEDSKKYKKFYVDHGVDEETASELSKRPLTHKRKVDIDHMEIDGHAFFRVKNISGGVTNISFNILHPFHKELLKVIEPGSSEDETDSDLLQRLEKAAYVLKIVFAAWARYEIEEAQDEEKLAEMRYEWGKMVKEFLKDGIEI